MMGDRLQVDEVEVYFLGGPNHQQSIVVTCESGLVPAKIVVEGIEGNPDPEVGGLIRRQGTYEESPFGGNVYLWRGWDEDAAVVES